MPKRGKLKIYFGYCPHEVLLAAVKEAGKYRRGADLDELLAERPDPAVLPGLARVNAHGRHPRRSDDVAELLAQGIDVVTTLRVSELSSVAETLPESVRVKNPLPDVVFSGANEVVLVDEPVGSDWEPLLPDGEFALLPDLRELALSRVAERLASHGRARSIPTEERVLVCVGPAPSCRAVVERAARLADAFHAEFTALYVETSRSKNLSEDAKKRLADNLAAAEALGATVYTVFGENIPSAVTDFAREGNITKVVLGRTRPAAFRRAPLVERLLKLSPGLDVYIIPAGGKKRPRPLTRPVATAKGGLLTVAAMAVCTGLCFALDRLGVSHTNIGILYFLCILLTASVAEGWVYGAASAVTGAVLLAYLFTEPEFALDLGSAQFYISIATMLAGALMASALTGKLRSQARAAAQKSLRTQMLFEASERLQAAGSRTEIAAALCGQLCQLLGEDVLYYPAEGGALGKPYCVPESGGETGSREAAEWCFRSATEAGAGTTAFSDQPRAYFPVKSGDGAVGVASIRGGKRDPFVQSLVYAMLGSAAAAEEKLRLAAAEREAVMRAEMERLSANILRSVSHDLRTPLTSISGSASMLLAGGISDGTRAELAQGIAEDADWLIRMVENLLSVSKMEGGAPGLTLRPELLEEVAEEAAAHAKVKREIEISAEELLLARMDAPLISQVIVNLLDNAAKFSPGAGKIRLCAFRRDNCVCVEVADEGPGVRDEEKEQIFKMFYSSASGGDSRRGFGLGLALAKSIVEAHGGEIYVRDNAPCGAVFGFTLKAEEIGNA